MKEWSLDSAWERRPPIPGNLIQGVFGLAVSVAAAEALSRSGAVKEL